MPRVQFKSGSVSPGSSLSVTLDSPTTAGNFLAIFASCYYAAGDAWFPWTMSDNNGSTVQQAVTLEDAGTVRIYYAENIAGRSGHQVTLSASGSSYFVLTAVEYSGVALSSTLDKTSSLRDTTAAYTSGTTATTAQADELLDGVHHLRDTTTTWSPGSSFSTIERFTDGSFHQHQTQDRIVALTGTYQSNGTASASADIRNAIATFKLVTTGVISRGLVNAGLVNRGLINSGGRVN